MLETKIEYTDEQLDEMYTKHLEQQEYERMVKDSGILEMSHQDWEGE